MSRRERVAVALSAACALALVAGAPSAASTDGASTEVGTATNLIVNGSFETPDIPTGSFAIFPAIPGWSHEAAPQAVTSSGIEIQDHFAGDPAAGAGDQFVELDSDGPSRVSQDVATHPGSTYRLTFLYSARPGTAAADNHFEVSAGPESVEIGPLTSAPQTNWTAYDLDFVATETSSRIEFLDLGPEQATAGVGAYIDEVALTLVNSPPDCTAVTASPNQLRRVTRDVELVTLSGASDPDGDALSFHIDGVAQDEPVRSAGTGDNTAPDARLTPAGADSNQVLVRAERSPRGNGRVYRVAFTVSDDSGSSCQATFMDTTARVAVPRRPGAPAVDDFATTRFDSFTGAVLP